MAQPPLRIPFNKPFSSPRTLEYLASAIASERLSGNGAFGHKCTQWLEQQTGCARAFLTPSCTSALEMSAVLAGLTEGDEIIVPSFTFVSTANAFALLGVRPVFADVHPDTLNIDPSGLEALLSPRTRALVAVHYAGVSCDLETLASFCKTHGLVFIEDNAHGLAGRYRGKPLGSFSDIATVSFHETKNFSCGEGGALLVNRPDLLERAAIIQEKGTNRSRFLMGLVDKYTWVDRGSSYLLGELPAAALWANFENSAYIQGARSKQWLAYHSQLQDLSARTGIRLPIVPAECEHPSHLYYLLLPDLQSRQSLIQHLASSGILAVFHYQPLHLSPMGISFGGRSGQCPVTEDVSSRLLRLPLFTSMKQSEQDEIVEAILDWAGP